MSKPNALPKEPGGQYCQTTACYRAVTATVSVGTSATLLEAATDLSRNGIAIQHLGANNLYIGGSNVTTANGLKVAPDVINFLDALSQCEIYAISDAASQDVRVMEII